jgi:hypothetical protein
MVDQTLITAAVAAGTYLGARGTAFLDAVLAPVGEEIGKDLLDRYKAWRGKNVAKVAAAAADMAREAGFEPQPIPGRVLWPLLEAASVEEGSELQQRWATLLANASDPSNQRNVTPAFVFILRELSPNEALMLDAVYMMTPGGGNMDTRVFYVERPDGNRREFSLPYGDFQVLSDNLHRLGLVDFKFGFTPEDTPNRLPPALQQPPKLSKLYDGLPLTPLGRQFMAAVTREPKDRT